MALWKAKCLVLAYYLGISLAFSVPRAFKRRPATVVYSEKASESATETPNEGTRVNLDDTQVPEKEPPAPVMRKLGDNVGSPSQTDSKRVSIVGPSLMSFGGQPERIPTSRWGPTYSGSISNVGSVSVPSARSKTVPKQASTTSAPEEAAASTRRSSASRQSTPAASAINSASSPYIAPISGKQTGSPVAPPSPGAVPVPSVSASAAEDTAVRPSNDTEEMNSSTAKDDAPTDGLGGTETLDDLSGSEKIEETAPARKKSSASVGTTENLNDETEQTTLRKGDVPKDAPIDPERTEQSATEPAGPASMSPPISEKAGLQPPRSKYIKGFDDFFATPGSGSFLDNSRAANDVWPTKDSSSAARSNLIRSGPDTMDPLTSDRFSGKVKTSAVQLESDSPAVFVPPKGTPAASKAPTPTRRAPLSSVSVSAKSPGTSKATTDASARQSRSPPVSAVKPSASAPPSETAAQAPMAPPKEYSKVSAPSSSFDTTRRSPPSVSPSSGPANDAPAPSARIPVAQSTEVQNDSKFFFAKDSESENIISDEDAIPAKYRVFSKDYMETLKAHAESNEEEGDDWTERYLRLKKGRNGANDRPAASVSTVAMAEADLFPELGEGIRVVLTILLEPIEKITKFLDDLSPSVTDAPVNADTSDSLSGLIEQATQTQPPSTPAEAGPDMDQKAESLPEVIEQLMKPSLSSPLPAETGSDVSGQTTRSLPEVIEQLTKPPPPSSPSDTGTMADMREQAKEPVPVPAPAVESVPEAEQPSSPLRSVQEET